MGASASTDRAGMKEVIPPWVYTVKIPPEYSGDKLGGCSDGMNSVGPNTVTRFRTGHFDTDGARWSRGFTSGKHTFEIVFPMGHRGIMATVGVSTEEAPLYGKGKVALVGSNKHSWGICLRSRRAYHKNGIVKRYPQTDVYLPDKFYMYIDADGGTLQFGSDMDYYGTALSGIPKNQPLYPTVSATMQGATITMVYRGMGDASAIGPPPPCVVPAAPQMMSPAMMKKEPPPPPPPTVISNTVPAARPVTEPVPAKTKADQQEPLEEKPAEEKSPAGKEPEEKPASPEAEAQGEKEAAADSKKDAERGGEASAPPPAESAGGAESAAGGNDAGYSSAPPADDNNAGRDSGGDQ